MINIYVTSSPFLSSIVISLTITSDLYPDKKIEMDVKVIHFKLDM